jgi:hypothetical protein
VIELARQPVESISKEDLVFVRPPSRACMGFSTDSFDVLATLRRAPLMTTYQHEKTRVTEHVQVPFKAFRDDLVANFVLPTRADLETERNVFSRIPKNDFGRGGANSHFWLAFYRPSRSRLSDVQLMHSLHPHEFRIGVSCPVHARTLIKAIRGNIGRYAEELRDVVSDVIAQDNLELHLLDYESGRTPAADMSDAVAGLRKAGGWRVTRAVPRKQVIDLKEEIVDLSLDTIEAIWPFYRLMTRMSNEHDG